MAVPRPFLVLLFHGAMLVLLIVLLRLLVAVWAADIMEEKKPAAEGVVGPFSGMGDRGAAVMLDSLLGPALADPALDLRVIMLLGGDDALDLVVAAATGESAEGAGGWEVECLGSVGVGGVLTMTGVPFSAVGGVRGGRVVSMLCPLESRRKRSDGVAFAASGS